MISYEEAIKELEKIETSIGHDKEWEKLRDRIFSCTKYNAASLKELGRDVDAFFKSNAPEEDKIKLSGYTECLAILMDAVNNNLIK